MKIKGLTLVELLISIAIMGIVAGAMVGNIPSLFRANKGASQSIQTAGIARAYFEDIRSKWPPPASNQITFSAMSGTGSLGLDTSNLSSTLTILTIQGRDSDIAPTTFTTCSSILTTSCTNTASTTKRWVFNLTIAPTSGTAQTYVMEMGR